MGSDKKTIVTLLIATCLSAAEDNFCDHITQLNNHCIKKNRIRGTPGAVDYEIIDKKIKKIFQDTENRLNKKIANCKAAVNSLREATDCSKVSMKDIKKTGDTGGIVDIYPGGKQTEVCDWETDGGGWLVR
ncbi:uncharacterized protein LOC144424238 [Styela clava]